MRFRLWTKPETPPHIFICERGKRVQWTSKRPEWVREPSAAGGRISEVNEAQQKGAIITTVRRATILQEGNAATGRIST